MKRPVGKCEGCERRRALTNGLCDNCNTILGFLRAEMFVTIFFRIMLDDPHLPDEIRAGAARMREILKAVQQGES